MSKSKKAKKVALPETLINIIIDESGSMGNNKVETIQGFNTFLAEQKKVKGKASLSLIKFNSEVSTVYAGKVLKEAAELTPETYTPNGYTALHDAIGKTVKNVEEQIKNKKNYRVLFLIMTDGAENASKEYHGLDIKKMVEEKTALGNWTFTYLGANQDAIVAAQALGILTGNSANFKNSSIDATMKGLSMSTTTYRGGAGGQSVNYFGGNKNV